MNQALADLERMSNLAHLRLSQAPMPAHVRNRLKKDLRAEYQERKAQIVNALAPASPDSPETTRHGQ